MISAEKRKINSACYFLTVLVSIGLTVAAEGQESQNTGSGRTEASARPMIRGIELYRAGKYNEALDEFNAEARINNRCPLAYYYAARIRLEKNQHSRARQNLIAALRDSSDFSDARAVLACTLKEMGETNLALAEWRRFVRDAGPVSEEQDTPDSIVLPEQYSKKRDRYIQEQREAREKEEQRRKAEEQEIQRLAELEKEKRRIAKLEEEKKAAAQHSGDIVVTPQAKAEIINSDSPAVSADAISDDSTAPGIPDSTTSNAFTDDITSRIDTLDERMKSDIRKGMYGLLLAFLLLAIGFIAVFFWFRLRKREQTDLTFSMEVDRHLHTMEDEEHETTYQEEDLHDYHEKRRILSGGVRNDTEKTARDTIPSRPFPEPDKDTGTKKTVETNKPLSAYTASNDRRLITEEIKALVTRMYREGHAVDDISRAADLTKTEVELIVAVRTKRTAQLIEEVNAEEDSLDTDTLYRAIRELVAEGESQTAIAQKLGISKGEVTLALAILRQGVPGR